MYDYQLPANIDAAKLPTLYQRAIAALAACNLLDECKDWANKAEAIASYARQAHDMTLLNTAQRIRHRAYRRLGELLREYDARGDHRKIDGSDNSSRSDAARNAGLSARQQATAMRIVRIAPEAFDKAVESTPPPSLTKLSEMGKAQRREVVSIELGRFTISHAEPTRAEIVEQACKEARDALGQLFHASQSISSADLAKHFKKNKRAVPGLRDVAAYVNAVIVAIDRRR